MYSPLDFKTGAIFYFLMKQLMSVQVHVKNGSRHADLHLYNMSRIVRKQDFCLCENKDADQLCSNCEADNSNCVADQRLFFSLHG